MPLPNFFLIGAPKSGTTALYYALVQHPEIFMSAVKEPVFFASEGEPPIYPCLTGAIFHRLGIWQPEQYLALFTDVTNERAIGEASVAYLRSATAAQRIQRNIPHAKIIALLRQPAERAYSHYWYMVQHGIEPAATFEEALQHEDQRIKDHWFSGLYHKNNGFYHAQLAVYHDLFPPENIKIFLYEDWKQNPQALLQELFRFLEVDEHYVPEIKQKNVTALPKNRRLYQLAQHPERVEDKLVGKLPIAFHNMVNTSLQRLNRKYNLTSAPPINPETYRCLTEEYREDILKLQPLINRDLSHWLRRT